MKQLTFLLLLVTQFAFAQQWSATKATTVNSTDTINIKQGGKTKTATISQLPISGGGVEITSSTIKTNFKNDANWQAAYGWGYQGPTFTGQSEHDYFVGTSTSSGTVYKYELVKIGGGALVPIRYPLQFDAGVITAPSLGGFTYTLPLNF